MTLGLRKFVVAASVGGIFVLANALVVTHWLREVGAIDLARNIREQFLTGTAITIIVAMLILLVKPAATGSGWIRRCPVCDHRLLRGKYCGECGSKA